MILLNLKVKDKIIELIFPNVCGICGNINKNNLCPKCMIKLKNVQKAQIIKINNMNFSYLLYMFKYEGIIREKIIKYKFKDMAYLYKTFSRIIIKNKKICGFIKKYDIIIPVPIHKKRKKERGYNQSELLAKELANKLNLTLEKDVLIKVKNNQSQRLLSKNERKKNAKNVYEIKDFERIKNKNIILIDDIYTTGSTVNECCRMLKKAKVNKISVLTIAKD